MIRVSGWRNLALVASVGACRQEPVDVQFVVRVGDQEAACGTSYGDVGSSRSTVELLDLRFYISSLSVDGQGALTDEPDWQARRVALLDFEDNTGACKGTSELRTFARALVSEDGGTLEFDLGLPASLNHLDATKLESPLNVTSLFWGWTAGYRFLKLDLATTGQPSGWPLHVGSSGCAGLTGGNAVCTFENLRHVKLAGWSPDDVVVLDLAALLAGANVDTNSESTGPGCMSEPDDPDCAAPFAALGLPFADAPTTEQSVFSLE